MSGKAAVKYLTPLLSRRSKARVLIEPPLTLYYRIEETTKAVRILRVLIAGALIHEEREPQERLRFSFISRLCV
jgi:hypothetical protein